MAYNGYNLTDRTLRESTEAFIFSILEGRGDRLNKWLSEQRSEIKIISLSPHTYDIEKHSPYGLNSINLYDLKWSKLKFESEILQSELLEQFKDLLAKKNDLLITIPVLMNDGGLISYIGSPVFDKNRIKVGYVIGVLDIKEAAERILNIGTRWGKTKKIYLVSENGIILTRPREGEEMMVGKEMDIINLVFPKESKKVYNYIDYNGNEVLGAVRIFPELRSIMVVEVDKAEAMSRLTTLQHRFTTTVFATIIIVSVISIIRAWQLSRPLKILAHTAREIGKGNQDMRLGTMDTVEAQRVADAFNQMLDELAASREKLARSASLQAIGMLSSSIVHEIRNPLSSIKMNLQALEDKVKDDELYRELALIASERVRYIEEMLNELLQFGKPLTLNFTDISFCDIYEDVYDQVREKLQKKEVTISKKDFCESPVILFVDKNLIVGAITNLVINAIDAVDKGGYIEIDVRTVTLNPSQCMIDVKDNGPGLKEKDIEKLFKPFFTTKSTGTGLGLANVKKIVEYHSGSVSADNLKEGGAVFTITIPYRE
jgi:signal transduction histidine kinase